MTAPLCASACGSPSPEATICRACTARLSRLLARAADIAPDLDDAVARLLKRGAGGKRTGDEQPLPLNLAASDVAHALRDCLAGWVHVIRQAHPRAWPGNTIPAMASWLNGQLPVIRRHEAAAALLADVAAHVDAAVAVLDRPPERFGAGTCARCGAQLWSDDGQTAACQCGHAVTGVAARRRALAAACDELMTPRELAASLARLGCPVAESTISSWGTRGRLTKRPGGLYRLSDALALAAARSARA